MKILVLGNCQAHSMSLCLATLATDCEVHVLTTTDLKLEEHQQLLKKTVGSYDLIFSQPHLVEASQSARGSVADIVQRSGTQCITYPLIYFSAYHPDTVLLRNVPDGSNFAGVADGYHSAIIYHAFRLGLSERQTNALFNESVFAALGYFNRLEGDIQDFLQSARQCGLHAIDDLNDWLLSGPFMLSMNHPKLYVMESMARLVLKKAGITADSGPVAAITLDPLLYSATWPVYPEIAERLSVPGSYLFKASGSLGFPKGQAVRSARCYDLEAFISASFRTYGEAEGDQLACSRQLSNSMIEALKQNTIVQKSIAPEPTPAWDDHHHPYKYLPDVNFWSKAISGKATGAVDPVSTPKKVLTPKTKVITAGSCFAQHLARTLKQNNFSYLITEAPPKALSPEDIEARQFGVFSARYGNIYNIRQMAQLIDRAYAAFTPEDDVWKRTDGRYVDAFRPTVEPDGYESAGAVRDARESHFDAVRTALEQADVLIFTLGLTEAWESRIDGAIYPLAPGVAGGEMSPSRYKFTNFNVAQTVRDLNGVMLRLQQINPAIHMVLTVSPVPLAATYETAHVLTATTYSKSVLRSAAQEIAERWNNVDYFPSYEIITGAYNQGAYFEDDKRGIRPEGVNHVMRLFMQHYTSDGRQWSVIKRTQSAHQPDIDTIYAKERQEAYRVICDEEMLVPK